MSDIGASPPYSKGPLALPYQRPSPYCRTFSSPLVERVIEDVTARMTDVDLARIFENAFPNTLDTTVSWQTDGSSRHKKKHGHPAYEDSVWEGAQSFIVTGDITAEWLRDSTNQLQGYQALAARDSSLATLILGAINTQAEYVIRSPYCNAFQPPPPSKLPTTSNGQGDTVHPAYEPSFVFECKYELDSLAHFLKLANEYHAHTGKTDFMTKRWFLALDTLLGVLDEQSQSTFNDTSGLFQSNVYLFQRQTDSGTETLNLRGLGNPVRGDTGLVRSAFRPSDDATILPFLIPANAMMAVELRRTASILKQQGKRALAEDLRARSNDIEEGIKEHAVVPHKKYGDVYAFEVDGYGSHIMMDDANIPSLLALPVLGFVEMDNEVYRNTRNMILDKRGNPYFLTGEEFEGIGGPHIGLQYAWPMSLLIQAMTSDDDDEIMQCVNSVRNVSRLGLIHESIHVNMGMDYTRKSMPTSLPLLLTRLGSWFAWANSVFAQTILNLAERKPHLLFGRDAKPYRIEDAKI
jgi:meiotically up-regulated gene 157 (Mug157) protein